MHHAARRTRDRDAICARLLAPDAGRAPRARSDERLLSARDLARIMRACATATTRPAKPLARREGAETGDRGSWSGPRSTTAPRGITARIARAGAARLRASAPQIDDATWARRTRDSGAPARGSAIPTCTRNHNKGPPTVFPSCAIGPVRRDRRRRFPQGRFRPITGSPGRRDRSEPTNRPEWTSRFHGRNRSWKALEPQGHLLGLFGNRARNEFKWEMAHRWRVPKRLRRTTPPPIVLPPRGDSVYKYFSEQTHADGFLDGHLLFRTLAYFRDNEDAVRGDEYEGTSKFLPEGGLVVHNQTQGTTFTLPMAFESSVRAYEIFVYCTSLRLSADLAEEFRSVACVEVTNVKSLCERIRSALPRSAKFTARPVEYYSSVQACSPRWALPDQIATSKLDRWTSQNEYRFLFSLTDALGFEKVTLRLASRQRRSPFRVDEHIDDLLSIGSIRDICVLYACKTL